jgi:ribosome-binding factor A
MAGTIRKHLGSEIARQARDPRLASIYIETVELASDLGLIRVGVRSLSAADEPTRRGITRALSAMAKGLRASLGPVLRMRRMPELKFFYDQGADHRARIDAVLAEIQEDDRTRAASADPPPDEGRETTAREPAARDSTEPKQV